MDWLKRFHNDHAALVRILSKLEGNLKDIEYGEAGVNVIWELREFVELVHNVVIPHFKAEEENIYPRLAIDASEGSSGFISGLYEEHNQLYEAFEGFAEALLDFDKQEDKAGRGQWIAVEMARSGNSDKLEAPENFNKITRTVYLEESVDKETLLQHGFVILELLEKHLERKTEAEKPAGLEKDFNKV